MVRVCPTCGGTRIGCPTCQLPGKRNLPKSFSTYLPVMAKGELDWEVRGIDISKWNGDMNFSITKTKCQYGFMRLGYGTQWKDPKSDTFYRDAIANDFPMGVYWYLNIGQNANLTADSFAEEIRTHAPQLDIVLDAEYTTINPNDTLNWLKTVYNRLVSLTGKQPIIYTSAGFWNEKVARSSFWSGKVLWVANWTNRDTPYMPLDWTTWTHWQWSADGNNRAAEFGSTNGDPDMDLDRFYGTCVQFNAKYGTHISPIGTNPPPPPPGEVPEMVLVNSAVVNLRSAPNPLDPNNICATTKLNYKLYPEAIEKDQFGKDWYKLGRKIYIKTNLTRLP